MSFLLSVQTVCLSSHQEQGALCTHDKPARRELYTLDFFWLWNTGWIHDTEMLCWVVHHYFTPLHSSLFYFTPLHFTPPHFHSLHLVLFTPFPFTPLHFTSLFLFTSIHFISLHFFSSLHFSSFHFSSSVRFAPFHLFTSLFLFTSLHFTSLYFSSSLWFTSLYLFISLYFTTPTSLGIQLNLVINACLTQSTNISEQSNTPSEGINS